MPEFKLTREEASSKLGISTRTIDRYIKSWKLSYKKVANKILLSTKDIQVLEQDFNILHQKTDESEIISNGSLQEKETSTSAVISKTDISSLEKVIDDKIDKFFLIFQEKDRMLEEKNKVIFMLQQRVSELENKLGNMVALPDYNEEKQKTSIEKVKLEDKIKQLSQAIRGEKTKSYTFLFLFILVLVWAVFWYVVTNKASIMGQ